METLPNNSAFPEIQSSHNPDRQVDEVWSVGGLTIRAYIATKILSGLISNPTILTPDTDFNTVKETAIMMTDKFIEELNK